MTGLQGSSAGAATVFRRIGTDGWLVLAGSIPDSSEGSGWLDHLLARMDLDRPAVWLSLEAGEVEPAEFLDDLEDTLMTSVAIASPSDSGWEEAGLLLLGGPSGAGPGPNLGLRLKSCLDLGGVVMAMGLAAGDFGDGVVSSDDGLVRPGLGWLSGGLILTGPDDPQLGASVRGWLQSPERRYALRLPEGSVFALGPGSEAEVWGGPPPGIILGPAWTHL